MTLLFALVGLLGAAAGHAAGPLDLPEMGSSSSTVLSAEQERQIGESAMRSLRSALRLLDDPVVESYVQNLGDRLAAYANETTYQFTFFVVDDPSINAFAMPGGYIGVHVGLILAAESEHELAAVLAHEIAHVTQRHIARQVERQNRMGLPGAAAILAAMVLSQYSPQAAQAALATYTAGSIQMAINHTRAHEYEADRVGIQLLARAGFDPEAMPAFFERLQRHARLHGSAPPEILSTHPVHASRIADARHRAEEQRGETREESVAFHLAQARLRVLLSREPRAVAADFQRELAADNHGHPETLRYGRALALLEAREVAAAQTLVAGLLEESPDQLEYLLLKAEVEKTAGHAERSAESYRELVELYPGNVALTRAYASTLMEFGRAGEARTLLRDHLRYNEADAQLYHLLARAHSELGEAAAAHQAMAEHYYLNGNVHRAVEQLRQALRRDDLGAHERARVNARLENMELESNPRRQVSNP
ncbi:M48 family metallopeptidase [Ectothiorhodospiraceae bacterium 2226]|nr:M48 family metallopeptidase [Ectothiorhodospiraceae bacterium 2226]